MLQLHLIFIFVCISKSLPQSTFFGSNYFVRGARRLDLVPFAIASHNYGDFVNPSNNYDDQIRPKIIGGDDAYTPVPYQVSLQVKLRKKTKSSNIGSFNDDKPQWAHNCGGSIITKTYILTAAHCVVNFNADRLSIVAGTSNRKKGGKRYLIKDIIVHEGYEELRKHDIALMETEEEMEFGRYVASIGLQRKHVGGGVTCTLTGWGYTIPVRVGGLPEHLQIIKLPTISNAECKKVMKFVTPGEICTKKGVAEAACGGDSGGPLVCGGKVTGIVSYGTRICGTGAPDVFTRVSEHIEWIEDHIVEGGSHEFFR